MGTNRPRHIFARGGPETPLTQRLCVFPSRARVRRTRRDSTCVGDYPSPRGDLATGPVHSPFVSLSVRVNTRVSGFATSLIIVGPVTTPSDRLCRCCQGPVPWASKMTLCRLGPLGEPVTPETLMFGREPVSTRSADDNTRSTARSSLREPTHHHETCHHFECSRTWGAAGTCPQTFPFLAS